MSSKILLVDPRGAYGFEFKLSCPKIREPLGLEYIAASIKREGYETDLLMQTEPFDRFLEKIAAYRPDIAGFSCMSYDIDAALNIARILKERNPKIITIFGGEHPSVDFSIVKKREVDFVVYKEGEETIKELLSNISIGTPNLDEIEGIAYLKNSEININPPRERINNLDQIPFPYRKRELIEKCIDNGIAYPAPSEQKGHVMVLYSRGCSFDCSFCSSPYMWDRMISYRTPQNVLKEIEHCRKEFGTNYVFFADFTFNANKKRLLDLCNEIQKSKLRLDWCCQARADLVDEESISKMASSGCKRISFGVESLDDFSLKRMNKKENLGEIIHAFELANKLGILTRASYILGFPWQTRNNLEEIKKRIKIIPADELRTTFYTLFPGTKDWQTYKSLLMTDDWSLFDNDHVTIKTKDGLSVEELENYRKSILESFYKNKEYETRMNQKVKRHPEYKKSYDEHISLVFKMIK